MESDIHPVNLGIIGTGIAARELHLPAIRKLGERYRIVAVCDHTPEKGLEFIREAGDSNIEFFTDYRDLLALPSVEAVDIALPIELNYPVAKDSLEAGKHVILEKPPATSVEDANKLSASTELHSNQIFMIAENFRYFPVLLRVRELLAEHAIGTPYSVVWQVCTRIELNGKYAQTPWRIDHQYPGGFITDTGVHYIAGLKLVLGDIISGSAHTQCINPLIGELDTLDFQFLIRNEICPGENLSLRNRNSNTSISSSNNGESTVSGHARNWEQGSIKYQTLPPYGITPSKSNLVQGTLQLYFSAYGNSIDQLTIFGDFGTITAYTGEKKHLIVLKRPGMPVIRERAGDDRGYQGEFKNFYEAIRMGMPVIATIEESCQDFEIILRIQEAARERKILSFTSL